MERRSLSVVVVSSILILILVAVLRSMVMAKLLSLPLPPGLPLPLFRVTSPGCTLSVAICGIDEDHIDQEEGPSFWPYNASRFGEVGAGIEDVC